MIEMMRSIGSSKKNLKDARESIFDVRFDLGALTGFVLHRDQGDAAMRVVNVDPKITVFTPCSTRRNGR